ncbi:uncharacterized protein [Panulirus ornatus]|uniref:uncharacterized protein isoform X2 n=1 Tax=Panulirus ornatus TaxID=150431 RepID=UPI003A88AC3F
MCHMACPGVQVTLWGLLLYLVQSKLAYKIWSGLTGVLEEVDMRRYEDTTGHRLAQNECLDYIKVVSETGLPHERQCGSWSVSGQERLTGMVFRRALVGYCPTPPATGKSVLRCGMSELTVEVSVGQRNDHYLWRDIRWRPHRGFTFVVTAYRYSYRESECATGLRSCGTTDRHGLQHHCVHQSLWCDHHINCGQPHNFDEISCHDEEMLGGLVSVMVGPWVGAALLLVLVLAGVIYWRRARPPAPRDHPPPQELNSYAESYEVSSTLSSAHHMAIQVRVVCNSGHGTHSQRSLPWSGADLPPSYESLFPQGPPSPKFSASTSTATTPATNSAASFDITTTSLVSLGSNTSTSPAPSAFFSNTTQTSSIVIPISAMCNSISTSGISSTSYTTTTAFTTPPIFTNTTACATSSSQPSNTQTFATSPDPNSTPTATITVASLGPSLSTRATISVMPNLPDEAPVSSSSGDARLFNKVTTTYIPNSSSIRGMTTPINPLEVGINDTNLSPSPRPPSPNITPPLVEPEDTEITPFDTANNTPVVSGFPCSASGDAEGEAMFYCASQDISDATLEERGGSCVTTTNATPGVTTTSVTEVVDEGSHKREAAIALIEVPLANGRSLKGVEQLASLSLDTGQIAPSSVTSAEEKSTRLIDAHENAVMTSTDASVTATSSLYAQTVGSSHALMADRAFSSGSTVPTVMNISTSTEAASGEVLSTAGTSISTSTSDTHVVAASEVVWQQDVTDISQLTRQRDRQ